MTAKNRNTGETFGLQQSVYDKLIRHAILIAVLSLTTPGQNILRQMGVIPPAVEQTNKVEQKVDQLTKDVESLKSQGKETAEKVEALSQRFTGFQIDFSKYQKATEPKP